jgi:predicted AlkP superfamily phosphohydrolase/phosphomutase
LFAGSVWPSFHTGVSPARHGKYCSYQIRNGSYDFHRVHGFDARFETLWDLLSRHGSKVAVIDAPKSGVSTRINGIQLVDWATEDFAMELRSSPAELAGEIRGRYGTNPIVELEFARAGADRLAILRKLLLARLEAKAKLSEDLLSRDEWDFFFTLFTEVHTAGHVCWHLHDRNHPLHDEAVAGSVGDIVRDIYVATDAALGSYIARAGPQTYVCVYSVNGMGANYTGTFLLDDILLSLDRNRLSAPRRLLARTADWMDRQIPGRIYGSVYPLQRALRRSLALPVRDSALRSCFRVPSNAIAGGVRVNLAGREPQGIVAPRQYDEFCATLVRDLSALVNGDTGNPVVRRVIRTHDVYAGEHLDDLPDLLVEWTQDAPVSHVHSPATGSVRKAFDGHRTGEHRSDGILFVVSPSHAGGEVTEHISVVDLAPTLGALLNARFADTDGRDVSRQLGFGDSG